MRIGDVIAMVALVICVLIAVIITANMQTVIGSMGLTGVANTTAEQVFTNAWTGLTLASVGIIITAAVGILALVLSTLGRAAGGSVA
jgi:ABC-type Fe3+ transport system permease subunit